MCNWRMANPVPEIRNLTPEAQNAKSETGELPAPGAERGALAAGAHTVLRAYRGTSLISNQPPIGPYGRSMPRALWRPWGGGLFVMSEVPLQDSWFRVQGFRSFNQTTSDETPRS